MGGAVVNLESVVAIASTAAINRIGTFWWEAHSIYLLMEDLATSKKSL